jgi:hypothetical protein
MSTDANNLERIRQKFVSLRFHRFSIKFYQVILLPSRNEVYILHVTKAFLFLRVYPGLKSCTSFQENVSVCPSNKHVLLGAPVLPT